MLEYVAKCWNLLYNKPMKKMMFLVGMTGMVGIVELRSPNPGSSVSSQAEEINNLKQENKEIKKEVVELKIQVKDLKQKVTGAVELTLVEQNIAEKMMGLRLEKLPNGVVVAKDGAYGKPFVPTEEELQWKLNRFYTGFIAKGKDGAGLVRSLFGYERTDSGKFVKIEKDKK